MKMELSTPEKKTLIRIEGEFCAADQDFFPEYPGLIKVEIHEALKRLAAFNLIYFDSEIEGWNLTEEGEKYLTQNHEDLKELYDAFYKRL